MNFDEKFQDIARILVTDPSLQGTFAKIICKWLHLREFTKIKNWTQCEVVHSKSQLCKQAVDVQSPYVGKVQPKPYVFEGRVKYVYGEKCPAQARKFWGHFFQKYDGFLKI